MTPGHRPCAHCGLPVRPGGAAAGPGPFCCSGCGLAWQLAADHSADGPATDGTAADGTGLLLARVVLSAFLAMGVMVASLALYAEAFHGDASDFAGEGAGALRGLYRLAALALAAPVAYLLGLPLARVVVCTRRFASADGLILLGTGAAFLVSVWNTLVGRGEVYFETATMVLVLVGVGRWLDARAKERARRHVGALAEEAVAPAMRIEGDLERAVPLGELRVGDLVRVRPGEVVPVDGLVLDGRTFLDRARLSGESRPVPCRAGDRVLAGATTLDGALVVRAEAVGAGRVRDEVERLLERALARGGRFVALADRIAAVLMPLVLLLACGAAWFHWRERGPEEALSTALAVVLISCPCALGLATPLAFWTALGRAWSRGVLVRGGDVLERLARARRVFFDKTGTLTGDRLELAAVQPLGAESEGEVLRLAAALELSSEHPIGRSLRRAWLERGAPDELPPVRDFRALPGIGVEGTIAGAALRLSRPRPGRGEADLARDTLVLLERDGEPLARFELRSHLVPHAAETIAHLRSMGLEQAVLTGDGAGPSRRLATELDLPLEHDLLPDDKLARVERAGAEGTVYVGDGLNDAAALAAADVGVAVASGSPRSVELADVHLLGAGIEALPGLLALARRAVATARMNLVWAFAYNSAGLWLAASGRLTPVFAAAAMVLSSAFVVVNSTRRPPGSEGLEAPPVSPPPRAAAITPSGAGS